MQFHFSILAFWSLFHLKKTKKFKKTAVILLQFFVLPYHSLFHRLRFQCQHCVSGMVLSQIHNQDSHYHYQHSCQKLRNRKSNHREDQLICAKSLNPYTSKSISEHIKKKQFPFILFMLSIHKQYDQKCTAPEGFI